MIWASWSCYARSAVHKIEILKQSNTDAEKANSQQQHAEIEMLKEERSVLEERNATLEKELARQRGEVEEAFKKRIVDAED